MVVDRDTEIGKDIDKDIAINVAEALRTKPLVEKYLMFSGNLVSLQRNMESFKFRRDHGLPLKNEYNETLRDEQDLLDSYIAETGEKYDPANVTELDKQKMETWYGKKLGVLKGEFETAEKNILQSFSKCPDILAESKHLLSQFYKVDISKQKNNNTYRLDITGSERRKHLEAYKNKSKIPDDLVDKDVENLINKLVADAIFKKGEVDLSILEPEMIPWFKAYPILKKFTELPTMDSSLAKKQNAADLQNYRDYLKTLPADSEEAEKIRTKIQQLEADADELAIKKDLRESMSLRLKNPGNPLLRFYLEKRRLKAINDAKRIILKETDGKYRDAMITRLKILEGDSLLTCEEHKSEFYTPYNSSLKIKMPLTQKQQDMTQAFVASHDRIAELMKIGMQDADTIKEGDSIKKEDRKEVAGLMANARNLIRNYEDQEYERALQLREKQARKKEEERRKQEEKQRKKEEEEAQRKKENE
ncbi:MAG: hypothetical protein K6G83_10515 [Lachnospiraceae bacterium]|nr:hypothetical protein [Lachnospiraceae bacterium]